MTSSGSASDRVGFGATLLEAIDGGIPRDGRLWHDPDADRVISAAAIGDEADPRLGSWLLRL